MPEIAGLNLRLGRLRLSAELNWGDPEETAEDEQEPPPVMGRPDLIEVPELDLDDEPDEIDRLGFQ